MSSNLTQSAFSALRWNYLGFLTRSAANLVIGIVLARLLGPRPFGQLAAAALVLGLANLVADGGFSAALVQAPELTSKQIRFAFTIQVLIAVAMTTTAILTAGSVASLFHDAAVQPVLIAIAPIFLLQALGQTSVGLLKRKMAFREIQTAQVFSYLGGYLLVGIPAAYSGAGVWSLVAAQLVQSLLYAVQVYVRVRHSVIPCLTRSGMKMLWFGARTTGANMINWAISNLDNLVAGHAFGSTSLGLYSRAYNLASVPADGVVGTCQQVLLAGCSRASDRLNAIRRAYLAAVGAVALVVFPVFWSMAACAETVVGGLYGKQWSAAAPLFRPLAIAIAIHSLMALAGPILSATDHVEREVRAQALTLVIAVIAFTVAIRYSVAALAWAVLGAYVFRLIAMTSPALRLLSLGWSDVLRMTLGPACAGLATAAAVFAASRFFALYDPHPVLLLAALAAVGAASLFGILFFAGDRILPVELVGVLTTSSLRLPRQISLAFQHVDNKQKLRTLSTERFCSSQS